VGSATEVFKEGRLASHGGRPGRTRACGRSVRRNSMRFQKRQWLTLQVRSEHRGRRAVASGSDRGGTVVMASAQREDIGGTGARRAKQKGNAKRRKTGSTKPGRSKTETKVGGRGRAAGGWWRLRKVGWSEGGGRKKVALIGAQPAAGSFDNGLAYRPRANASAEMMTTTCNFSTPHCAISCKVSGGLQLLSWAWPTRRKRWREKW